jgi:hypothetical protein
MGQRALKPIKELAYNAEHLSLKANIIITNEKEEDAL